MEKKRKVYAPFSLTSEAGVTQTPVEGYIDVNQVIYPTVNTGTVNENGKWAGVKSDDTEFFGITKHVAIANGGTTLSPDNGTRNHLDMTGFKDLFLAIKPTNGGNVSIVGAMGPDTNRFANLSPIEANAVLKGLVNPSASQTTVENLLFDSSESLTADVWNIFFIGDRFQNQKNLNIRITNNSGGESTLEVAFLRMV